MQMIWPDLMTTNIPASADDIYPDLEGDKRILNTLAVQLSAWALCSCGVDDRGGIPKCFGTVMAKLSQITGAAGPDACSALAKKMLPETVT